MMFSNQILEIHHPILDGLESGNLLTQEQLATIKEDFKERQEKNNVKFDSEKNELNIEIYGVIGKMKFGDEVLGYDDNDFSSDIEQADENTKTTIYLNSPGGLAYKGVAIHNQIKRMKGEVNVIVDGEAASAAVFIPLAADNVFAYEVGKVMIHESHSGLGMNKREHRKLADILEQLDNQTAEAYAAKTGKEVEEVKRLMEEETYFTAKEAKEFGFVDEIIESPKQQTKEQQAAIDIDLEKQLQMKNVIQFVKLFS